MNGFYVMKSLASFRAVLMNFVPSSKCLKMNIRSRPWLSSIEIQVMKTGEYRTQLATVDLSSSESVIDQYILTIPRDVHARCSRGEEERCFHIFLSIKSFRWPCLLVYLSMLGIFTCHLRIAHWLTTKRHCSLDIVQHYNKRTGCYINSVFN